MRPEVPVGRILKGVFEIQMHAIVPRCQCELESRKRKRIQRPKEQVHECQMLKCSTAQMLKAQMHKCSNA